MKNKKLFKVCLMISIFMFSFSLSGKGAIGENVVRVEAASARKSSRKVSKKKSSKKKKEHECKWVKKVHRVKHPAKYGYRRVLVKEAWVEEEPVYIYDERYICKGCGADITDDPDKHMFDALDRVKPQIDAIGWVKEGGRCICNVCHKDITDDPFGHKTEEASKLWVCGAGWYTDYRDIVVGVKKINHPAVYKKKKVLLKKAYTEKETYYKCRCGAIGVVVD